MRFVTTASFEADYKSLEGKEKELFRRAIRRFNDACDAAMDREGPPRWPRSLRVKRVEGAPGVWELTWSFSGPDGRATWEWTTIDVEGKAVPAVRWRRLGDHRIFDDA